ncbi:MAG: tetratricopeptide repeat protein [Betaproteobacteria bacterium]
MRGAKALMAKTGRNERCPCGSGKKYKQCCMREGDLGVPEGLSYPAPMPVPVPSAPQPRARNAGSADAARLLRQGDALQSQQKWDDAIACYREALVLAPAFVDAHNNLGALLHRRGRLPEALACYRAALSLRPGSADLHYNLASALRDQGVAADAAAAFRRAISLQPDHLLAHCNLGNLLGAAGDPEGSTASYARALAIDPECVEAHYNLGVTLQRQGSPADAIECYRKALALQPTHFLAHFNLGNALADAGDLQAAADAYRRSLQSRPDFAAARSSLGNVLRAQGRLAEAIECYRLALASRPDDAGAHNNLGNAHGERGDLEEALASYRRALELQETPEYRTNVALCLRSLDFAQRAVDPALRHLLMRAMAEAWTRPADLARACASAIGADPVVRAWIERASAAWPAPLSPPALFGPAGLATLAGDALLRHLLESTPICDIGLERLLTMTRASMLDAVTGSTAGEDLPDDLLAFHCAVARQCFINEYVFFHAGDESQRAARLRVQLSASLQAGDRVSALRVVTAACYAPLSSLPFAAALLQRPWPSPVEALLAQQLAEPAEERRRAGALPTLTPIEDAVSNLVRRQYEENPYPRWIRLARAPATRTLRSHLRELFPHVPRAERDFDHVPEGALDVLIAGCGTGQEAIEAARQVSAARVLAIDLSRSSLAYAARKTDEAGVASIEYAQADVLQLASIGRSFDMISAVGVLHHLADPAAGLAVLVSLLREGGVMRLGFYSESARRDVVAARAFIAEQGYASNAGDIRRCRQALIGAPERFARLAQRRDFHATSECRDLLFHVQEHRFTLPGIGAMLDRCGLRLIGFLLEPEVLRAYRGCNPQDTAATDLRAWAEFESAFPDTFAGMYRFWVRRKTVSDPFSRAG